MNTIHRLELEIENLKAGIQLSQQYADAISEELDAARKLLNAVFKTLTPKNWDCSRYATENAFMVLNRRWKDMK